MLNMYLKDSNEKLDQMKTRDNRKSSGVRSKKAGYSD
jgi:hypothetical protein